ncbi:MAG: FUSC family protein [Streptosporangiaceae bacterium]
MQLARRPAGPDVRAAVPESALLALACLLSYWLVTDLVTRLHPISAPDDLVGGIWAVIATIFVCRSSYHSSPLAGVSRVAATLVSFVLCELYLIFLPFHLWGLALLIGLSTLIPTLAGRPGDSATAAITTAVLLPLASLHPDDAWVGPIMRLADTIIGVLVGVAAAWLGHRITGRQSQS